MKSEEMGQKCPECGSTEKRISRRRNSTKSGDAFYIPHIPEGDVGIIRCTKCGHIFEFCPIDRKPPLEFKKKLV